MSKKPNQLRFSGESSIFYTNFFNTRALSALYAANKRDLPRVIINDILVDRHSKDPKGTVYKIHFHFEDGRGITTFEFVKEYRKEDETWADYCINRDAELFQVLLAKIIEANK